MKKFIIEVDDKKAKAVEKLLSSIGALVSEHHDTRTLKADLQGELELLTGKNEILETEKAEYLQMEKEFEALKINYDELKEQYEALKDKPADQVSEAVSDTVNANTSEEAGTAKEAEGTIKSAPLEEAKKDVVNESVKSSDKSSKAKTVVKTGKKGK